VKADSSVRICGDFKLTINRACKLDHYPIPRDQDVFITVFGGQTFSKLSMCSCTDEDPGNDVRLVARHGC